MTRQPESVIPKSESGLGKKKYAYVAVLNYASFEMPANITVVKSSSNAALTNGNALYSLEGAKYGLYTSDGKLLHEFVIDADGKTDIYKISDYSKSYYVSEITPGKGYELSDTKVSGKS